MLETIQWVLFGVLFAILGWLAKTRTSSSAPPWLEGLDEADLVKQPDLDQYHHRVVQLSHAQRDLLEKKIEQLERRIAQLESSRRMAAFSSHPQAALSHDRDEEDSVLLEEPPSPPSEKSIVEERVCGLPLREEPDGLEDIRVPDEIESSETEDSTDRILAMWRGGKPVEEIARELRMGRQEVQLLIEMSRHTPVGAPKG